MPKICEEPGCTKQSSYGAAGGNPQWCKTHAPAGARNVAHRQCEGAPGEPCYKQPNYALAHGPPGAPKRPRWCRVHASPGAIDVMKRRCAGRPGEPCNKQPWYGMSRGEKPVWCRSHAPLGALNVVDKQCAHVGCFKIPCFGLQGGRPVWCRAHAPQGARNVRSPRGGRQKGDKDSLLLAPAPVPAGGRPSGPVSSGKQHNELELLRRIQTPPAGGGGGGGAAPPHPSPPAPEAAPQRQRLLGPILPSRVLSP